MIDKINEQLDSLIGKVMFDNELITSYEFDEYNNKIILNSTNANCMHKYIIHNAIINNAKETYISKLGTINRDYFNFLINIDCISCGVIFVEDEHIKYPSSIYRYLIFDKNKIFDKANYIKVLQL